MDTSKVLPNEVWLHTFAYLSNTDLKTLRLSMDPNLISLASSLLFTTAYIAARKGVLETFTNLTTHPVFRAYVKEVVFDSSWIDPVTVAECANEKFKPALVGFFQQQEAIQGHELRIRLEKAFQCLSHVKKASYADLSRIPCLPGDCNEPTWEYDYSDGPLIRRLESDHRSSKIRLCCLMNERNAGCSGHGDEFQYRRRFGGLILLLQVLSDHASTTLEQLSLGSRNHACKNGGIPHWFLLSNTNIDTLYCFPNVFYGLRKLELSVSIVYQVEALSSVMTPAQLHPEHFKGDDLANILGLAKNLEELKLTNEPKAPKLRITNILVKHKWSRLRVVYLQGFEAGVCELEEFLKRHTLSLHRLTLDEFNLTSGSWSDFSTIIPVIAPALELLLGYVLHRNRQTKIQYRLPLSTNYLDISGPNEAWYNRIKKDDDDDDDDDDSQVNEEEEEDESEDESSSDNLSFSSDDSSPETEEPRRRPDLDLLKTLDLEVRSQIECLRSELPTCSVHACLEALNKSTNRITARTLLILKFCPDKFDTIDQETMASAKRLVEDMSFDCKVEECTTALFFSDGDYHGARKYMQQHYGFRQINFIR